MTHVGTQTFGQKMNSFFFNHWEKLVFAAAGLALVAFVYWGRVKPFTETTPRALDEMVKRADRYISDSNAWNEISNFRQGNETAVANIQAERAVKPEWYQVSEISGHPRKTRGLRSDPEIKTPLETHVELVNGSVIVQKPKSAAGAYQDDYWAVLERRLGGKGAGAGDASKSAGAGLGLGGRFQPRSAEDEPDKKAPSKPKIPEFPEIQLQEEAGVALSRLGVNSEQHTTKVVSTVCVTGLFPHELQVQEFNRCFLDSMSYNGDRDKPQYVKLEIQRRKMVDGVEGEWQDISDFVTKVLPRNFFAAHGPEVVEEAYVDPVLTMKIPPFAFANFRTFVTHQKVPRLKVEEVAATPTESDAPPVTIQLDELQKSSRTPSTALTSDKSKSEGPRATAGYKLIRFFDMFDLNLEPNTKVQYRFRVWLADPNMYDESVVRRATGKSADETSEAAQDAPDASRSLGASGGGGMGGKGGRGVGAGNAAGNASSSAQVDFLQLDPTVRERLRKLELEKFAEGDEWKRYCRASEWSPETNWIAFPRNSSKVLPGGVNQPNPITSMQGVVFSDSEPEVVVAAKKWDPQLQVPVTVAQKVARGSVLNFKANGLVFNPINRKIYELDRDLDSVEDVATGVEFRTESFVVDLLGGQKMPFSTPEKTYYFPSEVLVMDANGELRVHNTSAEKQTYRHSVFAPDESLSDVDPKKPAAPKDESGASGVGGRGGAEPK